MSLPFHPDEIELFAEGSFARARRAADAPPCPLCKDTGLRVIERDGVEVAGRCRCQLLPDRLELFNKAGLPARHLGSTFGSFNRDLPGVALGHDAVRGWTDSYQLGQENKGLVLFGEVGRGKTHLMVAALRRLIFRYGVPCRFVEFSHLLADLKEGFDRGKPEATLLGPLSEVEVLAIDELGKGRRSDWELGIIDELISRRYNAMKTTLATTNYGVKAQAAPRGGANRYAEPNLAQVTQQTLAERVGERVYSRLREMCSFVPVVGEDYRIGADRGLRG
ncbi:MAG: ATP-binding protein [Alphaproteobacteria bacterium]|nr:ATP-binding protein [Alphaproteobacteria bacterium]MCB9798007.1 ATP-binding protein [Alphaproteobacteria bacterium]